MAFWDKWPTWVKIAVPTAVVGVGALLFLGRRGGGEGTAEGEDGDVLPLITPSTGPSFPAGAISGGGGDYAPAPDGGDGAIGIGDPPTDTSPAPGGSIGGGGVGGTDLPGAPPAETYKPPEGPGPLTGGQRGKIQDKIRQVNENARGREERITANRQSRNAKIRADLDAEINRINAMDIGPARKQARRQGTKAEAAAKLAASQAQWAAAMTASKAQQAAGIAAAQAMFGAGRF